MLKLKDDPIHILAYVVIEYFPWTFASMCLIIKDRYADLISPVQKAVQLPSHSRF